MGEGNDQSFHINRIVRPIQSVTIVGPQNEPLVVSETWPDGIIESRRVINPERSHQIPINVSWDETVSSLQQDLVHEAFDTLYRAVGFDSSQIHFLGNWKEPDYRDSAGNLVPHKSVEWQIQSQWNPKRNQVNSGQILNAAINDPRQISNPHWVVLLTNRDLYMEEYNYVIGSAKSDVGTVISLGRLEKIRDHKLRKETQKSELFHEVSHIFGLPTSRRGIERLDFSIGSHCRSDGCSLKQGMNVPKDWVTFTQERLQQGGRPLCDDCLTDFSEKFKNEDRQ